MNSIENINNQIVNNYDKVEKEFKKAQRSKKIYLLMTKSPEYSFVPRSKNAKRYAFYSATEDPFDDDDLTRSLMKHHFYPPERFVQVNNTYYPVVTLTYLCMIYGKVEQKGRYIYDVNFWGNPGFVKKYHNYTYDEHMYTEHIPTDYKNINYNITHDDRPEMSDYIKVFDILIDDWREDFLNQSRDRSSENIQIIKPLNQHEKGDSQWDITPEGNRRYKAPAYIYCWREKPEELKGVDTDIVYQAKRSRL